MFVLLCVHMHAAMHLHMITEACPIMPCIHLMARLAEATLVWLPRRPFLVNAGACWDDLAGQTTGDPNYCGRYFAHRLLFNDSEDACV